MFPYQSESHKRSGVTAYEIGDDFIRVRFATKTYTYTTANNSKAVIDSMKLLALSSRGLSTFIARNKDILKHN